VSPSDPHADPKAQRAEFQQDVAVDKPGIVGARWWHQGLKDEESKMSRRQALVGLAAAGGVVAAISALGVGVAVLSRPESTALSQRDALPMQKMYGWDFGARGKALVFDGVVEGPFVRTELRRLSAVLIPESPANAKYYVPTLVESLFAQPTATLPDPEDGLPPPDGTPFRPLSGVIVPVVTKEMQQAYAAGEAVARLAQGHEDVAVLADLPGHLGVAFAAGAAAVFEPVLLLDNWPHPQGVVPSHMALAALAYYQPRFASQKQRGPAPPLFVLDRLRLSPYSEESDRFDNRYYARVPRLDALAKDGVRRLLYVVTSPAALPEPDDVNPVLSAPTTDPRVEVRALALTDFRSDRNSPEPEMLRYGGSARTEAASWDSVSAGAASEHQFVPRGGGRTPAPPSLGKVAVVATASGLILAGALDRRGSMNRFAGGWSG
jgi:hypothetical protein